jgi:hypothetical protein
MQKLTVEPNVGEQLGTALNQVLICDTSGRVIGFFSPLQDRPRIEDLQLEPPLSNAEIEQLRQKHRTGKPLEEILKRLGY